MNINLNIEENHLMATLQVKPSIVNQIRDAYLKKMKEKVEAKSNTQFIIRKDGILVIENRLCVQNVGEDKLWKKYILLFMGCTLEVRRCIRI